MAKGESHTWLRMMLGRKFLALLLSRECIYQPLDQVLGGSSVFARVHPPKILLRQNVDSRDADDALAGDH